MNILITQRHAENEYGDWTDSLENAYVRMLEDLGFALIVLPNVSANVKEILEGGTYDGICLTGGGDVGTDDEKKIKPNQRDTLEYKLLDYAVVHKIPVIGICRGMQSINVYFQGMLERNIKSLDQSKVHPTPSRHMVKVVDPQITSALNGQEDFEVNSYHDHAVTINGLGENLSSFAEFEPLSLVEGLYHEELPIAGIQWHPERENSLTELDRFLLESFKNRNIYWN